MAADTLKGGFQEIQTCYPINKWKKEKKNICTQQNSHIHY